MKETIVEWTPAATPPPKENNYLITGHFLNGYWVQEAVFVEDDWYDADDTLLNGVIAWAPLPEPYRPPPDVVD